MRIRENISIITALLILFTSCEEVIDIDLESAPASLVIEATISKDSVCIARLTNTTAYFENEAPAIIENAVISISDGNQAEILTYTGNGVYRGNSIAGVENTSYELLINYLGEEYSAFSRMPEKTMISSSRFSKSN